MSLPILNNLQVEDKRMLVRCDLDTDNFSCADYRIQSLIPTLDYLRDHDAKIILMGHKGRPNGVYDESLSLKPFEKVFERWDVEVLENLRFDKREEANDEGLAKELAEKGDMFVNEAFAASHRKHASIVSLPKLMPHAVGLRFSEEVTNLSKVLDNPKKPVISIISGIKEDKLSYIGDFKKISDAILIAGRLPVFLEDVEEEKLLIAKLNPDKEDITIRSIEEFEEVVKTAGTVVVSGPVGKFEEEGHRLGTKRVFEAVCENKQAYKVAGGGDTIKALQTLDLVEKFDWVSVGGGAMLEFLVKGTLPGIDILLQR
jgi:phosphoglycerate kinase